MRTATLTGSMVFLCALALVRVELVARAQEAESPQEDPPVEVETDVKDNEPETTPEELTIEVDPVTQALFEQYVLSRGKITTSDVEAAIALVASRGRSGDFWRVVLSEFDKAHRDENASAPRKNLLAVLSNMLAVDGAARWQAERLQRNTDQSGNVDLPQVSLSPVLGPEVLEHIIDAAHREKHLFNLTDYVLAVRQAHDPRGTQFLYDVLDGGSSRAEYWKEPQGGTWTEPQFMAAVALAELGDGRGVEWLIHYSDKLGTSLFRVPHAKSDELYLACNYALVELTGYQPPLKNGEWQQSGWKEWWSRNRENFVPAGPVALRVK